MEEIKDIARNQLTFVGRIKRTLNASRFSCDMDFESLIKESNIPQRHIAELSGIPYTRFRNCMSRDNYSFTDDEKEAIAKAILKWISDILQKMS